MRRLAVALLLCVALPVAGQQAKTKAPPKKRADTTAVAQQAAKKDTAKKTTVPTGASAQCRDGSYSFSAHRRGTCSHHGGVATWLKKVAP